MQVRRMLLTLVLTAVPPSAILAEVPDTPEKICPLLPGAEIPSVAVKTVRGESVELRSLLEGQPAVLIFYRGGW